MAGRPLLGVKERVRINFRQAQEWAITAREQGDGRLHFACGYMPGAVDASLEGAHRRIGEFVCLPRLCRPSGVLNTGPVCAGT
jgi:hypothetical protein